MTHTYALTLTIDERQAFDWLGDRYGTGEPIASILRGCLPDDVEWTREGDITFLVPEHEAWLIAERAWEEGDMWPCFAPGLAAKMSHFTSSIV
ncbi:MAG: hypothetical protein JOZ53_22600 [Planctomycetaceae bacterium]|nr:hypothetical protein [Planctomycetaceae bacterium]